MITCQLCSDTGAIVVCDQDRPDRVFATLRCTHHEQEMREIAGALANASYAIQQLVRLRDGVVALRGTIHNVLERMTCGHLWFPANGGKVEPLPTAVCGVCATDVRTLLRAALEVTKDCVPEPKEPT